MLHHVIMAASAKSSLKRVHYLSPLLNFLDPEIAKEIEMDWSQECKFYTVQI